MTTFVAGWIHVPSLLGVKVFGVDDFGHLFY